jgi:hypothetical protein
MNIVQKIKENEYIRCQNTKTKLETNWGHLYIVIVELENDIKIIYIIQTQINTNNKSNNATISKDSTLMSIRCQNVAIKPNKRLKGKATMKISTKTLAYLTSRCRWSCQLWIINWPCYCQLSWICSDFRSHVKATIIIQNDFSAKQINFVQISTKFNLLWMNRLEIFFLYQAFNFREIEEKMCVLTKF